MRRPAPSSSPDAESPALLPSSWAVRPSTSPPASSIARRRRPLRLPVLLGAALPFGLLALVAGCKKPPAEQAPLELLTAPSSFPPASSALPLAVPLRPLLAADQPEHLSLTEPGEQAVSLRKGQPLLVRFSRPMVDAGKLDQPAEPAPLSFEPKIKGKQRWIKRSVLSFEPDEKAFDRPRTVTMTVSPGLKSLSGEELGETSPRTLVLDTSPRLVRGSRAGRVMPGEPVEILFEGKLDAGSLSSQMMMYEVDGGRRMIPFTVSAKKTDERGRVPVEIKPGLSLEPGARMALALAPRLSGGGISPRILDVGIAPRPRIEGIACPDEADEGTACEHQGPPGRIVDIEESLALLSSSSLPEVSPSSIEVSPPVAGLRVSLKKDRLIVVHADWDPATVYQVSLGKLVDRDGHTLARMAPLAVRSAGRSPALRVELTRGIHELDARAELRLEAVHTEGGELRHALVPAGEEIAALLTPASLLSPERADRWQSSPLSSLVPSARPNRWGRGVFSWQPEADRGPSLVVVQALLGEGKKPGPGPALVQRTDLGLDVRLLPSGLSAWVTSIATGRPLSGVRVVAADSEGKQQEALTGDDGTAWLAVKAGEPPKPVAVVAAKGDDRAALRVDPRSSMGPRHLGVVPGDNVVTGDEPSASLFTDRGVYRAGELVRVKAVVRQGPPAARAPYQGPLRFKLMGPDKAAPAASVEASAGPFGSASVDLSLPDDLAPGTYRAELWREGAEAPTAQASFSVYDYRPPSLRVDLASALSGVETGALLKSTVSARYPFGAKAAGAKATFTLTREPSDSEPAGWKGFVFAVDGSSSGRGTVATGAVVLDGNGQAPIEVRPALSAPRRERAVLEVSVADAAGRATASRRSFEVFPAAYEVGVRERDRWAEHGTELDVEAIVVGHDGGAIEGKKVSCSIVREGWQAWWQRSGGDEAEGGEGEGQPEGQGEAGEGSYQVRKAQERKVVHRCSLTSSKDPVHCAWKPDRAGSYFLVATVKDEAGRESSASTRVYVAGPDEHPDRDPPGSPVTLSTREKPWQVGETAEVAFESPFPDAEALFQVQRDRVMHTERRRVGAGGHVFRFPVTADMLPNAFVSLTLVRPRTGPPGEKLDLEAPDLRVGLREIRVEPAEGPLSVSLSLPGPEAEAGARVPVEVTVTDREGKPVAAEVALYAVDEGTLRLTGYQAPEPGRELFTPARAWFAWEDVRRQLASRLVPPLSQSAGGDGGDGGSRVVSDDRERFDPTPLWAPSLLTGGDGKARTTLELPRRPTEYRVMAVAVDRGARSGKAETNVTARKQMLLRPALPRFVVEGDRFEVATFVHNTGPQPADASLTVRVDDQPLEPAELHLEGSAEQRVGRWVEATGRSDRRVRFELRSGDRTDVVEQTVHVAPRAKAKRAEVVGLAEGRREIAVSFPGALPGTPGDLTLTVAPHPFVAFDMDVEALDPGPVALAEQASSALIGLAAYAQLDTGRRPESAGREELSARASRAVKTLTSLQTAQGAFGLYGRESTADAYVSAYALHALARAKAAGFAVPNEALERASSWVGDAAKGTQVLDASPAEGREQLALALRALTEAGSPQPERIKALYDQRERLSPYGLAQLALAIEPADLRSEEMLQEAARRVLAGREEEARDQGVLRWYDSSPRTLGAVLEATSRSPSAAESSRKLASLLLRARGERGAAGGMTPHESAHSLAGLSAYSKRFSFKACPTPRVWWDGELVAAQQREGQTSWHLVRAHDASGNHKLVIESSDPAYFALASRWSVPFGDDDKVARGSGVSLHRLLETESGAPLDDGAHVKVGDLVRVRLFVFSETTSPAHLVLRGKNPGGFDVLDADEQTNPQNALRALLGMSPDDEVSDARAHYAERSTGSIGLRGFTERESLYVLSEGSGLREYTYGLRAAVPGTFLLPPAELSARYAPSVKAESALSSLTVDP